MNSMYFCYNLVDLCSEINAPLRQTQRIQYTCLDASSNYVVLGATSGSIYLFRRTASSVEFLQIIQNMYGPINHVAISPQEKFVTFSTVKGTICVYVIDLAAAYPQIVTAHYEDTLVTCLHWRRNKEQLFYGDNKGNVFLVNLTSFLGRNLTHISIHPILFLDSAIVQISDLDKLLLVSNYAKCILCNVDNEEFKQIGNTPRDGYYGACFLPAANKIHLADAKVFCARPGSRLWEADVDGRVLQTIQYTLTAETPPTPSFNGPARLPGGPAALPVVELDNEQERTAKKTPQLLHRLQPIFGRFIFSYNRNGFYIVDPQRTTGIVLWNDQIRDIQSVRIVNGATLVIFTSNRQVFSIACRSLEDGFCDLLAERQLSEALRLLMDHQTYFRALCLTQGYVANVLRLRQMLADNGGADAAAERLFLSGDCAAVLAEFGSLCDAGRGGGLTASGDENAVQLRRHESGGVHRVENSFARDGSGGSGDSIRRLQSSDGGDENIRNVLLSASRNIFNKFNIFNESATATTTEPAPAPTATTTAQQQQRQRSSSPSVIVPFHNVDMSSDPAGERLVHRAPRSRGTSNRRRPSSVPPAPPPGAGNNQRQQSQQQQQQQQQPPQPTRANNALHPPIQLSAEERLLQQLYMVYQTARISRMTLVERYGSIFDKYDCAGIRDLLHKLAAVMRSNGIADDVALAHCYEMYFNYLQPELLWEMDDAQREFVIAGFVLVNGQLDGNDLERCERCTYPLCLPVERARQARYRELGTMIFKYFWTRNQVARGFELATAVPWTMELCCKFQLQHATVARSSAIGLLGGGGGGEEDDLSGDEEQHNRAVDDDRRLLRNIFACGSADLLQMAVDQSDRWTLELWHQFTELLILLHVQSRMWCARCCDSTGADQQQQQQQQQHQAVNSEALLRNEFYAWPRLLDNLVQHIRGRNAMALVRKFADQIGDGVIPKEFYLKCLLVP